MRRPAHRPKSRHRDAARLAILLAGALSACRAREEPKTGVADTATSGDTTIRDSVLVDDSAPDTGLDSTGTPPTDADDDGWAEPNDCDDGDASVYPGAPEYCDAKDQDCDGESAPCTPEDVADYVLVGEYGSEAGQSLVPIRDIDGDGRDDLVVGIPGYGWGNEYAEGESIAVVLGGDLSPGTWDLASVTTLTLVDTESTALSYYSAADGGDTDGDGLADIVVTGERSDGTFGLGVFGMAALSVGGTLTLDDTDAWVPDPDGAEVSGVDSVGDVDGDGFEEVVLESESDDGASLIIVSSLRFWEPAASLDNNWNLGEPGLTWDAQGHADLDGDGLSDPVQLRIDREGEFCGGGCARVVTGSSLSFTSSPSWDDAEILIRPELDYEIQSAFPTKDLDGDGLDELAVAAHNHETETGKVAIFAFPSGSASRSSTTDLADATIEGSGSLNVEAFGVPAPDFDEDGRGDLVIPFWDTESEETAPRGFGVIDGAALLWGTTLDTSAYAWMVHGSEDTGSLVGYSSLLGWDIDAEGTDIAFHDYQDRVYIASAPQL